jgi:RNA polymerase sigma-70 factor (ECF subfamily)
MMVRPQHRSIQVDSKEADAALLARVADGDLGALGTLYDRYQAPLRRFVAQSTFDAHDVDDLVHGTFMAVAASAARYDGRVSCRPWLIGIAVQLIRRRRQGLGRLSAMLSRVKSISAGSMDPRTTLDARRDITRALARLSEAKRMTLLLAEVEGLSCAEIAEVLSVPIGTVWTRLHAARRELRGALGEGGA